MPRVGAGLVAGVGVLVLAVVAGVLMLTRAPTPHTRPILSVTPTAATSAAAELAGTWVVDQGSAAGYRVKEHFVSQSADSEAVARTSTVTGQLVLAGSATGLDLRSAQFSADISKLKSEDANATRGSAVRDAFVARIYLETAVYPMATFAARPLAVTSGSSAATLPVPGTFTVHGVTHDITIPLTVSRSGDRLEVVTTFPLHYPDYKIEVPHVPFTTANPDATIEVHLFLKRQA